MVALQVERLRGHSGSKASLERIVRMCPMACRFMDIEPLAELVTALQAF